LEENANRSFVKPHPEWFTALQLHTVQLETLATLGAMSDDR